MESMQEQIKYAKERPIAVGVFAVLATLSLGMALSLAAGFVFPNSAFAQFVSPCCVVTPTIVPTVVTPIVTSVIPTIVTTVAETPTPPPQLPPSDVVPQCKLSASPSTFADSGTPTLTWSTDVSTKATINHDVGDVSPNGGSVTVPAAITDTTTYQMTVTSGTGHTATCDTTVTITHTPPPATPAPTCELHVVGDS